MLDRLRRDDDALTDCLPILVRGVGVWGMDCGNGGAVCLLRGTADYEVWPDVLQTVGQALGVRDLATFDGWWGVIQTIFAIGGICVGVYFKWQHSERQLHNTLAQYLARCERRLLDGQRYVLDSINRPSPGQRPTVPLFVVRPLFRILRRRNWDRAALATSTYSSCDSELASAAEELTKQIDIAKGRLEFFRQQLATAHVVRGALNAATVKDTPQSMDRQILALSCFGDALKVDGQEGNLVASELRAHQLRKLGQYDDALVANEQFQKVASKADARTRDLSVARAKRYQAKIRQAQAIDVGSDGKLLLNRSLRAYQLLAQALELRERHDPYTGWDLLEQADLHYLISLVARTLQFNVVAARNLLAAIGAYEVVSKEPLPLLWRHRSKTRLRRLASAGLERAKHAKNSDEFERFWLVPLALGHEPKQQAHSVSSAGGE